MHGHVVDGTRRRVVALIDELWDAGAGGVLLGCTELELLIHQADIELPAIPCTTLHVQAALDGRSPTERQRSRRSASGRQLVQVTRQRLLRRA